MATTVIHVRDMQTGDVYIGRPMPRQGLAGSRWSNPYRVTRDQSRETAIRLYRLYLEDRPDLLTALPDLRGKRLACWCAPKLCHGDVLAEMADATPPARSGPPAWRETMAHEIETREESYAFQAAYDSWADTLTDDQARDAAYAARDALKAGIVEEFRSSLLCSDDMTDDQLDQWMAQIDADRCPHGHSGCDGRHDIEDIPVGAAGAPAD